MAQKRKGSRWPENIAKIIKQFGPVKTSLIFIALAIMLTLTETSLVNFWLPEDNRFRDYISGMILTLVIAPWLLFFVFELITRLQDSREELTQAIFELEDLRTQDRLSTEYLRKNIEKLNYEIEERKRAELQREEAIALLQQEIEERKRTERHLYEQSVLLRSSFDCSPDIIYYRDENGRFAGCNKSLEALTGMTEREMIGLTPWDVYSKEVAEQVVDSDEECFASNTSLSYDIWLTFPDGMKRLYEFKKVPFFNEDGKRIGLLGFGRDVMERKLAQDALEKASRDKTSFISTISHELRTPLNGIVGISRMLQESLLSSEQTKQVKTIYACAVTLGNIFNDIIDLDKIERDRLEINNQVIDIANLTDELATVTELQASQKGLTFNFKHNLPTELWSVADPTRLRQVLWNLLANAVKFTLKGVVELRVDCQLNNNTAWIDFEIEDSGIGIDENEVDNIFTMYYQVDRKEVSASSGTGIGLAISKILVDAMGGQIEVFSEMNKGSVFTVSIKIQLAEKPAEPMGNIDIPPLNILLVEDVELNVQVAQALLEKMGHTIEVARTGQEAIDMFRPEFDLVLLDIRLPDMTGFDVAKHYMDNYEELPPLVALTANVVKSKEAYTDKGLQDVIAKPIQLSQLKSVFASLFDKNNTNTTALPTPSNLAPSSAVDKVVNTAFMSQLIETIGSERIEQNLVLFQQLISEYLAVLDSNLCAGDQVEIASQAHKIKGAAASMGLKNIQELANQIQETETPAWWDNLEPRVNLMKKACVDDLAVLITWLEQFDSQ
ncbi:aerobic respiration two-component sensor histidine kinase ArcB [Algibacillus agarilyticus]|uniref:aerobic respiration two-component sensor histidine kinase ArcB n=1 Tax=Algibacillus agarilyticus TaxID=2234133 RepID=UPI000DCF6B5D|nr:aerobic respiration two-component sensor histidine kinase ArcB [Algibacillus agarilyticus]